MPSPLILLDMDGVICNWVKGACLAHGRGDLAERAANGEYPTDWNMDGELGSMDDIWWNIDLGGEEFWETLEPYPWMDKVVDVVEATGIPWYICTHARHTPESHSGKVRWIQEHLPGKQKDIILMQDKSLLSRKKVLLIDDNEDNCEKFRKVYMGGEAFLFPQRWNSNRGTSRLVGLRMAIEFTFGKEVFNVRV